MIVLLSYESTIFKGHFPGIEIVCKRMSIIETPNRKAQWCRRAGSLGKALGG